MLGLVLCLALGRPLGDARGVQGRGDAHDDVCGEEFAPVVCAHGDGVFHFGLADLVDDGVDLERQDDVLCRAVAHQFELAVRRHEGDDAVGIEPAEADALVELAVLECDAAGGGFGSFPACSRPV